MENFIGRTLSVKFIYKKNQRIMQIVSAREFRANQGKFLNAAKEGQTNETLTESICESLREVKMIREGKIKGKKAEDLLNEL